VEIKTENKSIEVLSKAVDKEEAWLRRIRMGPIRKSRDPKISSYCRAAPKSCVI
jgi:hypothetical protein